MASWHSNGAHLGISPCSAVRCCSQVGDEPGVPQHHSRPSFFFFVSDDAALWSGIDTVHVSCSCMLFMICVMLLKASLYTEYGTYIVWLSPWFAAKQFLGQLRIVLLLSYQTFEYFWNECVVVLRLYLLRAFAWDISSWWCMPWATSSLPQHWVQHYSLNPKLLSWFWWDSLRPCIIYWHRLCSEPEPDAV